MGFQKSPTHWEKILLAFGLYWVFQIFYLNEQLGSLLVDLAHQLSFIRFTSTLRCLKIHKFITYWSLEAVNIKESLILLA